MEDVSKAIPGGKETRPCCDVKDDPTPGEQDWDGNLSRKASTCTGDICARCKAEGREAACGRGESKQRPDPARPRDWGPDAILPRMALDHA